MEIFRQIETHFAALEEGQKSITSRFEAMEQQLVRDLKTVADRSRSMEQELAAVRGCFASVEAMLIANAAQMADVLRRLDILEKKAS